MKRRIKHADPDELNGEPLGPPGALARLDFPPSPEQVRQTFRTVKVTVALELGSWEYFKRQARQRRQSPEELIRRVLQANALAGA